MAPLPAAIRLGTELRGLRIQHGLSQRALVRALGLTAHSNLVQYELGRRLPSDDIIAACERILGDDAASLRRLLGEALAERARQARPGPPTTAGELASPGRPATAAEATNGTAGSEGTAGDARPPVVPAMLPATTAYFTARTEQLRRLASFAVAGGAEPALVILAITGTAGVGKTALAVHWAHRVRHDFPDGQLYVNLRGFDPTGQAMAPAEAIRGFLDALEVSPQRIPAGLDAQAGLYRSLLAGRRMLIVLDNARDPAQVRPLLPGAPGCLVLVTSRSRLAGLVAVEGAQPLTLDLLSTDEARQLLAARLGADRVATEARAVQDIIASCARLPLALAIVAGRAATHPQFRLAALAAELRQARGGLTALAGGDDPHSDLRAVFSWSYHTLTPPAARLFRLLGIHPGPDVSTAAAASLTGLPVDQMQTSLAELARANLVTEHTLAGTPSTTCSAPTPPNRPTRMTPTTSVAPPPTGCSTTTCTPRTLPPCCWTRTGSRSPSPRPSLGLPPNTPSTTRCATEGYGLVGGIGEYQGVRRMAYIRGPEGIIVSLAERIG